MAEKRCSHCGKMLSDDEKYCPDCGFSAGRRGIVRILLDHGIVVAILALVALAYIGYNTVIADKTPPMKKTEIQSHGMPPINMDQFEEGLPKDYASLVSMGNALMDQGKYEMAVACYNRALEQDSSSADVWVDLGTCEHALGKNEDAVGNFQKALAINPDHQIARFNLGIVSYTLGDTAQAVGWWESLLSDSLQPEMRQHIKELIRQARGD